MCPFPVIPDLPASQRAEGPVVLQYEDVSQDGRIMLTALPRAIGAVAWRELLPAHPITTVAGRRDGAIPMIARIVIEGHDGPITPRHNLTASGGFELSHTVDDRGDVNRLMLRMFATVTGPVGRMFGPSPVNQGQVVTVGRVCFENVFTRPFAPPDQRKFLRFDIEGVPAVPPTRSSWTPPDSLLALPDAAEVIDAELTADPAPLTFGLAHTDSNQHVNSLVYPRLFEDAAVRRFAERGLNTNVLSRYVDIAYRKPCFAGQTVRILLQAYRVGDKLGACGVFVGESAAGSQQEALASRPHCFVSMIFES
jgi:hypothetical protein